RLRARAGGGEAVAALDDRAAHEAPGALPLHRADPAHLPVPRRRRHQGDAPDGLEGAPPAGGAAAAEALGPRKARRVGLARPGTSTADGSARSASRLEPAPPAC